MKKISLIEKIELLAKGKYPHPVNGAEFERLAMDEGKKAANAGRRCRELESGEVWTSGGIRHIRKALERMNDGRKSVSYRWIPNHEIPPAYKPPQEIYKPSYLREQRIATQKII